MSYISIFFVSFISATLLPMGSEALFLLLLEKSNPIALWLFASIGNSLGSLVNYIIGRKGVEYLLKKKYVKERYFKKGKSYFDKYGGYSLLLSWVPIIGDPLTFVAGSAKYNIKKFILIVFFAKSFRYFIIMYLYL